MKEKEQTSKQQHITQKSKNIIETETGNERWNNIEVTKHTQELAPKQDSQTTYAHNTLKQQESANVPSTFLNNFVNVLESTSW